MNVWHDMDPAQVKPGNFSAVIEIPKGSKCKYELDKETGFIILDRILYTSTHYPANYGLIPRTYADDGDPLDVLLLCSEVIQPLSLVRIKLHTGRTHQIRVQFASRKMPLCGDRRYGSKDEEKTIALWSYKISFIHPATKEKLTFELFPCDDEGFREFY